MFDSVPSVVHVTTDLGKSLERILAPDSAGSPGLPLGGAVLTADYAATRPGLIDRLSEGGVPFMIEPQSMRFSSSRYKDIRLSTDLETGRAVNRMLVDDGQPTLKLEHLERWPAVLARVEERRLKETG